MNERTPLIAGNWKMNGLAASREVIEAISHGIDADAAYDAMICPPATLIGALSAVASNGLMIGAQDCHAAASGAHTGDLSAEMLADAGARAVIVGHSERRADHAETDDIVRAKAEAAWRAGLVAIICVGETEAQRDAGQAETIVASQLKASIPDAATAANTVIAYEPVWAIGTGRTPTNDDITAMHRRMRRELAARFGDEAHALRLLYGGSMKPGNAADILAIEDVDGGLVGGASLKADDFLGIIAAIA